jgi:hypothetical protein
MASKNTMSLEWEQAYVLMLKQGFLIPLNANERPNPAEWSWTEKAKRGVNDYISTVASPTRLHHFSWSTKTWYSTERPPYIPQTFDIEPRKVKSTREKTPEPIQINESVESPVAFSSIETFFQ